MIIKIIIIIPLFSLSILLISLPLSCLNSSNASPLGGGVLNLCPGLGLGDWARSSPALCPADFLPALSLPFDRLFTFLVPTRVVTLGLTPGGATPTPKPCPSTSPTRLASSPLTVPGFPVVPERQSERTINKLKLHLLIVTVARRTSIRQTTNPERVLQPTSLRF